MAAIDPGAGAPTRREWRTVEEAAAHVIDDPTKDPCPCILGPIVKPDRIATSGFFDPVRPDGEYVVSLGRLFEHDRESFRLAAPIGYWDTEVGAIIVPHNLAQFRTDLTSVPRFFTWLVPTTGRHLPAALVHDGLVGGDEEPRTYIASRRIDRATADRVFRSGMKDLGTSWARRWVIWAAVATATMVTGSVRETWRSLLAVAAMVLAVVVGGALATFDLVDCRAPIPWMGDRTAWVEVAAGALGAVAIPVLLSALWGRRWRAGVIAGVSLALLLHVTIAIVVVYALFTAIDEALEGHVAKAARWAAVAAAVPAALVVLGMRFC